ncbi:MAG: hypothetical protein FWH20_03920 [Oscillospiraceae bacterium]|nr:hypothetical protein [Oscillospiraceae bacterium]
MWIFTLLTVFLPIFSIGGAFFIGIRAILEYKKTKNKKILPRLNNLFFLIPVIIMLINYILIGISYYLQNNTGWAGKTNIFGLEGLDAWDTSGHIQEISIGIILLCLVSRIVFACLRKINFFEFCIWFILNFTAVFLCLAVIADSF